MTLMTKQDLIDAKPLADKIIQLSTNMRGPTVVAGVALALAALAHLAKCGPFPPRRLFGRFYRDLEKASGEVPGAFEREEVRQRLAQVLGEQKLLSLAAFAGAPLDERQRMLDAIIDALGVL